MLMFARTGEGNWESHDGVLNGNLELGIRMHNDGGVVASFALSPTCAPSAAYTESGHTDYLPWLEKEDGWRAAGVAETMRSLFV
jgi:hypothetical protein